MSKYSQTPQGMYHGPLPVRNFFPLPNAIFDLGLTAEEIAVYAFLMKCEDRRTYTCYPSYKTIGRAIGKSKNTVIKYVNMLEEKGLITKHKTFVVTKDGMTELSCLSECEGFINGFRLGVRLMAESFYGRE